MSRKVLVTAAGICHHPQWTDGSYGIAPWAVVQRVAGQPYMCCMHAPLPQQVDARRMIGKKKRKWVRTRDPPVDTSSRK